MFEVLTGKPPLEAASATALAVAHLSKEPGKASELALWVSAVYASLYEHDEALEWLAKIDDPAIRERRRAEILVKENRWQEAATAARIACEAAPDSLAAHVLLLRSLIRPKNTFPL